MTVVLERHKAVILADEDVARLLGLIDGMHLGDLEVIAKADGYPWPADAEFWERLYHALIGP
jgi:hypothetical protein